MPKPKSRKLDIPLGDVAVHYRGGAIIPTQRYANVTRDVRYSPVTLIVTLPLEVSAPTKDNKTLQGVAPYANEEACAAVHAANAGRLVSCGLLYADSDTVEVNSKNTVQVSSARYYARLMFYSWCVETLDHLCCCRSATAGS